MSALQESKEIWSLKVVGLLIHSLDYCVESINEIFFVDVEGGACTHFDYLKEAEKSSQNVANVTGGGSRLWSFQFELEVFTQDIYQVVHDFKIDKLHKLRNTQKYTLKKRWVRKLVWLVTLTILTFKNWEVDREDFLNDVIIVCSRLTKINTNCISLLHFI